MFGRRSQTSISDSLAKSRPVRYPVETTEAPATQPAEPEPPEPVSGGPVSPVSGEPESAEPVSVEPAPAKRVDVPENIGAREPVEAETYIASPREEQRGASVAARAVEALAAQEEERRKAKSKPNQSVRLSELKDSVATELLERIDMEAANRLTRDELVLEFRPLVSDVLREQQLNLNSIEQSRLEEMIIDEMRGLGPIEPLLQDDSVTDILVNGPHQVYVERNGKLQITDVAFRDEQHVMNIASRIVTSVGRRIDQTTPLADARLADGSRVNVIVPPLSLRGTAISIRKFSKMPITLDMMVDSGNLSSNMATVLKIASACRLNVVISGGTGSGKTTLLNAMSKLIDPNERIVTIEDAAELQLQQPHVLSLETRPVNLEGEGAITMRDLVTNALRMRPDRIILGEVRGPEVVDMLQAMNTGHDGSLATLHANRPREALTRLENMVNMANLNIPHTAIRQQIVDAIDMIVQISRMKDGKRRITAIEEVVGVEGEIITTQTLFKFKYKERDRDGNITGDYLGSGIRPHMSEKAFQYDLEQQLIVAMGEGAGPLDEF